MIEKKIPKMQKKIKMHHIFYFKTKFMIHIAILKKKFLLVGTRWVVCVIYNRNHLYFLYFVRTYQFSN